MEVEACRGRHAETKLIVVIDADTLTVKQRISQLEMALGESSVLGDSSDNEDIARLIPRRNIETWILCLNGVQVNEEADYNELATTGAA